MRWRVRPATNDDATTVAAVAGAAWRDTYAGLLRPVTIEAFVVGAYSVDNLRARIIGHDFLVAEGDAGIVAFADAVPERQRVVLAAIYTLPELRGRGAGTALLAAVQERHPQLPIAADVLLGNRKGESFYERHGFVPDEPFAGDLFGEPVNERRWSRPAGWRGSMASGTRAQSDSTGPAAAPQRIVDIHTHMNYHGLNIHDAVRNMDEQGIGTAWLLTWEAPVDEYGAGDHRFMSPHQWGVPFADVVHATELYPDRFVAGWAVDPRRPHSIDRLRAAVETYRVRVYGELKLRLMYDDLDLIEMYRVCGELRLPVLFHLELELPNPGGRSVGTAAAGGRPYWYGGEFDVLERFLAKCPETTFIGHASGFWREMSGDATTLREMYPRGPVRPGGRLTGLLDRFPNLYCDLSAESGLNALTRDPENARAFLTMYQDRLLFGRDYWDDRLLVFLRSLDLPAVMLGKILSGNALRLVPLA